MSHSLSQFGLLALGTRLRIISEQLMGTVKAFYTEHNLPFEPRWFPILSCVARNPGIGLMALAQAAGVSHAAVNAACKPLLEVGLVTLTADPDDARAKQVTLTPAGEVLMTRMEPAWHLLQQALSSVFPDDEAQRLLAMLDRLDDVIEMRALPRALREVARPQPAEVTIVAYDAEHPEHKRYFAALNIEWLEHYFHVEPFDEAVFADPVTTIIRPGGAILMACCGKQIVGTCALIKRGDGAYEMGKMAVTTLYQGRGIGTRLVAAIEDEARQRGASILRLVSSVKLPHAVPTYRRLGYVDSRERLHDLYERADITLEKTL